MNASPFNGPRTLYPAATGLACLIAVTAAMFGCAPGRSGLSDEELVRRRAEYLEGTAARRRDSELALLQRMKQKQADYLAGRRSEPPTFDVLILSGGGDFGAFGAGFLEGWSTVTDPQWTMPEFDLVTGVSTGALIAPFAFLGDRESLQRATALYREPRTDWINLRGLLFFLPNNQSLLRIDGLKRDIMAEFSMPMIGRIVTEADRGRILAIGTTNLDFGTQRVWDMGSQGRDALQSGSADRFVDILLASSAIPGAFPAIEIDGNLYADGGITANILYNASAASSEGLTALWRQEFPGTEVPKARFWVIVNNQLVGAPEITQPTWTGVTRASVSTAIRSATNTALNHLSVQLQLVEALGLASADFHYVAIPEDWRPPVRGAFQPETMSSLADLGLKMGSDPASWRTRRESTASDPAILPPFVGEGP
jgi:predicted acylesterase/phospholipase RssA